jgi:magnesium transporter
VPNAHAPTPEGASGRTVLVVDATGARSVGVEHFQDVLAEIRGDDVPVTWVHSEAGDEVVAALEASGLHELAVKSLREGPERPRVEEYSDHLYVSFLRASASETDVTAAGVDAVGELRVFLGSRWVVSLGRIDPDGSASLVELVMRQVLQQAKSPCYVLYYLAEWAVGTFYPVLDQLDDRVDALEDLVLVDVGEQTRQELFRLKRDLVELRRRVAPMRDVMQRLSTHGSDLLEPGTGMFFRDVHDDVLLVLEQLDTHRDILSSALDLHLSTVSNRLNEVMKRLTVFATIFMPLTFITGLFGMNFTALPIRSVIWFWLSLASMVIMGLAMVGYAWRRKWL